MSRAGPEHNGFCSSGQCPGSRRVDVIVGDVFHDIADPYHLVMREYGVPVHDRLAPGGFCTLSVVDVCPDPRLVKSRLKTLRTVFAGVRVWIGDETLPDSRVSFVIPAGEHVGGAGAPACESRLAARVARCDGVAGAGGQADAGAAAADRRPCTRGAAAFRLMFIVPGR